MMSKQKKNKPDSQVEVKRERPLEHQDRIVDTLDDLEAQARTRIAAGHRTTLGRKMNLEWSHMKDNFNYYWFVDGDNQQTPHDAVFAGWEFERFEHGSMRGDKVIKRKHGVTHYLMRMPSELYDELKNVYNKEVNRKDRDLLELSAREYGGDSKEMGKGKPVQQKYVDNPEISPLME